MAPSTMATWLLVTLWRQYHSPGSGTGTPQHGVATTSGTTVAKDMHVSAPRTGDHSQGRWVDGGRQTGGRVGAQVEEQMVMGWRSAHPAWIPLSLLAGLVQQGGVHESSP